MYIKTKKIVSHDLTTHLLLAHSQADEADALDGLSSEQAKLLLNAVLHDVFEGGHEQIIVRHKLLLGCISHGGDGRHNLLQHQFSAFLDQLEESEATLQHMNRTNTASMRIHM